MTFAKLWIDVFNNVKVTHDYRTDLNINTPHSIESGPGPEFRVYFISEHLWPEPRAKNLPGFRQSTQNTVKILFVVNTKSFLDSLRENILY